MLTQISICIELSRFRPNCCHRIGHARERSPSRRLPIGNGSRKRPVDVPAINSRHPSRAGAPTGTPKTPTGRAPTPERPYARADRGFDYYRAAYRFGAQCATLWRQREWAEAERSLHDAWMATAGTVHAAWDEVKAAVHDAWDHVRGRSQDERTHIR